MKTFINKKTGITKTIDGEKTELGYADIAHMALNTAPQGGWTAEEMRSRIKIMDKLDNQEVDAKIKLEDAEFEKVFECSQIKWKFFHRDIVAYDDYLQELKKK